VEQKYDAMALVEGQSGWDKELIQRTNPLVHTGAFDEAVHNAFILLEERLRKVTNKEDTSMTGGTLVQHAFDPESGKLIKHFAPDIIDRKGVFYLFAGAFKLYRNPSAHRDVDYTAAEGKSILALVNLLLHLLDGFADKQLPENIPENLRVLLTEYRALTDANAASRLTIFLGQCLKGGLQPRASTKQWVPFRRYALMKYPHWDKAKPHAITVFYLYKEPQEYGLWFPVNQFYSLVVNYNTQPIAQALRTLNFMPTGKTQDYSRSLQRNNTQGFYNSLREIVFDVIQAFENTLQT
jgi:uncharacterized protein (TIGR02391 family)